MKGHSIAFGDRLRLMRKVRRFTIAEVAKRCDMTSGSIVGFENGRIPRADVLFALADLLEVDPRELLEGPELNQLRKNLSLATAAKDRAGELLAFERSRLRGGER